MTIIHFLIIVLQFLSSSLYFLIYSNYMENIRGSIISMESVQNFMGVSFKDTSLFFTVFTVRVFDCVKVII